MGDGGGAELAGPILALEATGISRHFGSVQALNDVDFTLLPGEVHALVGENGAGKSTLAKIIAGSLRHDAGSLKLFGEPYEPQVRRDGVDLGVAHVRQQLSLVRGLTVAENLQLGRPKNRSKAGGVTRSRATITSFDARSARAEIEELSEELGLEVPANALVDDLALATRQQAEIIINIAWGARLLVLDEPSSALGPIEVESLIALCQRLRGEGTPILYISHRIPELVELADRLTVLRQGEVVVEAEDVADADLREIARLMIGDLSLLNTNRPETTIGPERLDVDGVSVASNHGTGLRDVSLKVRSGEIVGVVGVAGNGQEELAEVVSGQRKPDVGGVFIDGADITGSAIAAIRCGIAVLHEDRATGLAHDWSLTDNLVARRVRETPFSRWGLRSKAAALKHAKQLIPRFNINPGDPVARASSLSGGNKQKLMAARELEIVPTVLVASGPTKGLDPPSAKAIREDCLGVAKEGGAVLIISADLDEVAELCDRIVVLSGGIVTDRFPVSELDPTRLGAAMAGLTGEWAVAEHA